jgi:hypothetical protein
MTRNFSVRSDLHSLLFARECSANSIVRARMFRKLYCSRENVPQTLLSARECSRAKRVLCFFAQKKFSREASTLFFRARMFSREETYVMYRHVTSRIIYDTLMCRMSLFACIHTYIHTYIHACIHTYIHTYIHAHIHT